MYWRGSASIDANHSSAHVRNAAAESSFDDPLVSGNGGSTSAFDSPVPRWSTSTMSRVACTSANSPGSQPKASVPAPPGPPATAKNASGSGDSACAGTTATRRRICRPVGSDRSSGTSSIPHRARAVTSETGPLMTVHSTIVVPAKSRTDASAAVVGTAVVLATEVLIEVGESAVGADDSDEEHAAASTAHSNPAVIRTERAPMAVSCSPELNAGRAERRDRPGTTLVHIRSAHWLRRELAERRVGAGTIDRRWVSVHEHGHADRLRRFLPRCASQRAPSGRPRGLRLDRRPEDVHEARLIRLTARRCRIVAEDDMTNCSIRNSGDGDNRIGQGGSDVNDECREVPGN